MAKRFIDTEIFTDKWFMSLSKDSKLFWIYLMTNCNHAGIIELNEPLIKLQTDIRDLQRVIEELGNRLVTLSQDYYFIPKFLIYQYNGFPNSNVRAQQSAIDLLRKFSLWDEEKQTVIEGLLNPYEYGYGSGYDNGGENADEQNKPPKTTYNQFYDNQISKTDNPKYHHFVKYLFGENMLKKPLNGVLSIAEQLTSDEFEKVIEKCDANKKKIGDILTKIENDPKYYKGKKNLYRTLLNWAEDRFVK